jgi:nucleoside-diphosphate-sugar epimerase
MQPAARFVDVRDVAALHIALMLDENSDNRRLFAAPHKFSLNGLLEIFRKGYPHREILADLDLPNQPNIELEDKESTALLEAFSGRKWIPLEETVLANVQAAL